VTFLSVQQVIGDGRALEGTIERSVILGTLLAKYLLKRV
jgi:hypothetical protein